MTSHTIDPKSALNVMFRALRKRGFIALQNHLCCGSCACADISDRVRKAGGDPETANYVFYHRQNTERMWNRYGEFQGVYLSWGGDAAAIVEEARRAGFAVEHDGTPGACVHISGMRNLDAEALPLAASFAADCGVE